MLFQTCSAFCLGGARKRKGGRKIYYDMRCMFFFSFPSIRICGIDLVCLAQYGFNFLESRSWTRIYHTSLKFDSRKVPFRLGNTVLGIKLFYVSYTLLLPYLLKFDSEPKRSLTGIKFQKVYGRRGV